MNIQHWKVCSEPIQDYFLIINSFLKKRFLLKYSLSILPISKTIRHGSYFYTAITIEILHIFQSIRKFWSFFFSINQFVRFINHFSIEKMKTASRLRNKNPTNCSRNLERSRSRSTSTCLRFKRIPCAWGFFLTQRESGHTYFVQGDLDKYFLYHRKHLNVSK